MRTIWALALLGMLLLIPLASAGDVASSEASGVLGVGTDNEDEGDQGLATLTSESQDSKVVDLSLVLVIVVLLIPALLIAGLLLLPLSRK